MPSALLSLLLLLPPAPDTLHVETISLAKEVVQVVVHSEVAVASFLPALQRTLRTGA